jgi:hypothetical protein
MQVLEPIQPPVGAAFHHNAVDWANPVALVSMAACYSFVFCLRRLEVIDY